MAPLQPGLSRPAVGISGKRLIAAIIAAAFVPNAFALWGDKIELFADESWTHDTNVFRLSRNLDPVPLTGSSRRGDDWWTTTVGANLDIPVSLQRFQLNGSFSDARYHHFKGLNHHEHAVRGEWDWAVRRELSGDTGYAEQQHLASFANIQSTTPDIVKNRQAWFNGAWFVTPSWRAHTSLNIGDSRHGDPARRVNNLEAGSAEAGLSYVTPLENRVGVAVRVEKGRSPESILLQGVQFNNEYRQTSIGVQGRWLLTAHSRLDGRFDFTKREYEQFTSRDYSGPTWQATYTWMPTVKTRVAANIYRNVAPLEDIQSRFILITGANIRPQWDVTEKISIRGNVEYSKWDYRGSDAAPGLAGNVENRVKAAGMGLVWKPFRDVLFQATYQHEQRSSTLLTGDYKTNVWIVEGRAGF